jgi:hypothetical protein
MLRWEVAGIRILFDTKAPGGRRALDAGSYSVCPWHGIPPTNTTQHTTQRHPSEHNHSSPSPALSDSESESSTIGSSLACRRSQRTGESTVKRMAYIVTLDVENLGHGLIQLLQLVHQQHANLYASLAGRCDGG